MSLPQQQPPVIYPNTVTRQPPSHSNGSFGTVFIVLGVIVVISAIACVLGRLCNRRRHHHPNPKQNSAFRPKEPDLEFGFDKGRPTAKPAGNGGPKHNGHRPFENGEIRAENKPTESTAAWWWCRIRRSVFMCVIFCWLLLFNYFCKSHSGFYFILFVSCSFLVANLNWTLKYVIKHSIIVTYDTASISSQKCQGWIGNKI